MSDNSFVVKKSLSFFPQASAPLNPTKGDMYKDLNNNVLKYNGSSWVNLGSGSGVGDLDTLYTETFDESALADFTYNGLVLDSVSPLNGLKSAQLVHQAVGSQFFKKTIAVPEKYRGQSMTVAVLAKSQATVGNVTILFRDETNNVDIQSSQQIQADSSPKTFQFGVRIPSNCQSFSYTITALAQSGSPVTVIDDIAIRFYWMGTASQGLTELLVPSIEQQFAFYNSSLITGANVTLTNLTLNSSSGSGLFSYNSSTGIFTVLKNATFNISFAAAQDGATPLQMFIVRGNISTGIGIALDQANNAGNWANASAVYSFNVNDTFSLYHNGGSSAQKVTILATAITTKSVASNDLVPAKAMNGNVSIDVPVVMQQGIIHSATGATLLSRGGTPDGVKFDTANLSLSGDDLFTIDNTTNSDSSTRFIAKKNCSVFISLWALTSISSYFVLYKNQTAVMKCEGATDKDLTAHVNLNAGDYIWISVPGTDGINNDTNPVYLNMNAIHVSTQSKTWSSTQSLVQTLSDSTLRLNGTNGYGSTATMIRRFSTLVESIGSDVVYTDSATQGGSFTIVNAGTYHISYFDIATTASAYFGLSKNASSLTTPIGSTPANERLILNRTAATNDYEAMSWAGYLPAGTVIRAHGDGAATPNSDGGITISRVGSVTQINTVSDQKIEMPTHELRFENYSTKNASSILQFTSLTKLRGDGFTISSDSTNGTVITILKAGKIDISSTIVSSGTNGNLYILKNTTSMADNGTLAATYGTASVNLVTAAYSGFVSVGDVLRVAYSGTPTADVRDQLNISLQEQKVAVSVSNILPQFSDTDSHVALTGVPTGNGLTMTKTIRFPGSVETNKGTSVVYADTSANGSEFTINEDGLYFVSIRGGFNGQGYLGIARNQTTAEGSDHIYNLPNTKILCMEYAETSTAIYTVSGFAYLTKGDIVRPQFGGTPTSYYSNASAWRMTISKIGKPNCIAEVTPFINIPQLNWQSMRNTAYQQTLVSGTATNIRYNLTNVASNGRSDIISVVDNGTNTQFIAKKRCSLVFSTVLITGNSVSNQIHFRIDGNIISMVAQNNTVSDYCQGAFNCTLEAGQIVTITTSGALRAGVGDFQFTATALSDHILTESEVFSTDTTSLQYSSAYTLTTLKDAPVGTLTTFTIAAGSNTPVQTSSAPPTQTSDSMRTNGLQLFARPYLSASTAAQPAYYAIQIGKGFKGVSTQLYKTAGKVQGGSVGYSVITSNGYGMSHPVYDPATGILIVEASVSQNGNESTRSFVFPDGSTQTSAYVVINASKNPALVGFDTNDVAAKVVNTSAQTFGNGAVTTVVFDAAKTFDTHNAFNTSTGVFTAPVPGYYQLSAAFLFQSQPWTAGNFADMYFLKNGIIFSEVRVDPPTATVNVTINNSDLVYLAKGDTLSVQLYHTRGASTNLFSGAEWNHLSIIKV